jgi:cellobiose phosphorylase
LLGIRPSPTELVLRPTLLAGLNMVEARIPLRGTILQMTVRKTAGEPVATVNGKRMPLQNGKLTIPLPQAETAVEFDLPASGSTEAKGAE